MSITSSRRLKNQRGFLENQSELDLILMFEKDRDLDIRELQIENHKSSHKSKHNGKRKRNHKFALQNQQPPTGVDTLRLSTNRSMRTLAELYEVQ
jgi:hypothetical protein